MARLLVGLGCVGVMSAQAVTITVRPTDNGTFSGGFRYTIQEDPTFDHTPDVTGLAGNVQDTLSLAFHKSHAKVVKVGRATGGSVTPDLTLDPSKRYFVTVMPDNPGFGDATPNGYTMNGVGFKGDPLTVSVPVNPLPFKTAQVSVFVFEDNAPVNGAADAPGEQEAALCGFEVQLFEAGGTYGASGGRVSTDTFGNPLGTEYEFVNGVPQYNDDGSLKVAKIGANQLWTDRNGVIRIKNLSPAKYTIYSIAPNVMPSVTRCNFADANGQPTNVPIWVKNEASRTRPDQMVWDTPYEIAPPALDADRTKWHQTTTIEGTWGVDAWVKSGEPAFFKEFGPPGHHVWHGFVRRFKDTSATGLLASGGSTVTGKVVSTHMSRPPGIKFFSGEPMSACWVALNEVVTGTGLGRTLYANACAEIPDTSRPAADQAGSFRIGGLKQGQRYQLSIWDEPLDNVIANYEFTVPCDLPNPLPIGPACITQNSAKTVPLNDVPVFSWFSKLQGKVFYDREGTGFPFDSAGAAKPGIPGSIVNIRFRDGSIYQSTVTDDEGNYEFPEFFPFFNWMVAETDFTRFKATGATIISDNGGAVVNPAALGQPFGLWPDGQLSPQAQPDNGGAPYRIFGGLDSTGAPVAPSSANLLQAMQGFLGQTNIIHWGKKDYTSGDPNDHGGITGVVHYASTRAEFDPKFATAENNEPGIPSVEIRLYKLDANNMVIDPANPTGPRIAPKDANEAHAVQVVVSDSFDKAMPENCVDPLPYEDRTGKSFATGTNQSKCYDGLRIWNQVRDGVFDGGWAFVDRCPDGTRVNVVRVDGEYDHTECVPLAGGTPLDPVALEPGRYMTEGVAPYGYEHQKEEDKNVDFGDLLSPGTLANPAECMGSRSEGITYDDSGNPVAIPLLVPAELETFPGVEIPARFRDAANAPRPYCNKKLVVVAPGMNPFSDFHMFAKAPVAGHIVGMILDDLANEFDPYSPSFGEKYAPPFMPISIRDYAGNEINRVYSDRYGTYNALVPSTFAYNVPLPSGVAPNMVNVCLNSPTMKDAAGNTVLDPHYNPQYSQYCYTFQYLPGKTTYLDTPVLPIAAFAGPSQYALDCEQPEATPGIKMVTGTTTVGGVEPGPWVPAAGSGLRIVSMGMTQVNNPAYEQTNLGTPGATDVAPKTFTRNFGFGTQGAASRVLIGGVDVTASVSSWTDTEIRLTVPAAAAAGGTVEVVHANGSRSPRGVTLHVGGSQPIVVSAGQSIQAAIDGASPGALITVGPGLYEEAPIVWKRLRVQGYGAPVSIINAAMGAEYVRQQAWRAKVCDLVLNRGMGNALVGDQTLPADMNACLTGDTVDNAPLLFATEEASGFFILQNTMAGGVGNRAFAARSLTALQIDGFTVTGADTGGGIVANGNAVQLQISNNRITGNQGLYNGGIRIGHPGFVNEVTQLDGTVVLQVGGSNNPLVNIHHNEVLKNGNLAGESEGGGGGISLYTGADGYLVTKNYVCGNFSTGDGGGLAHYGRSTTLSVSTNTANPVASFIAQGNRTQGTGANPTLSYAAAVLDNQFRFNQSFSQAKTVQGGGLAIMGVPDPNADNGLSAGSGNVVVANNVIQGNLAGAGDGGGIALVGVNGTEVQGTSSTANWNRVDIVNNVIVNNGAGVAGGGISLLDSSNVYIVNNTVSLNDSYATAARAFSGGDPTQAQNGLDKIATSSLQNGAGIAAYRHSAPLRAVMPTATGLGNHRNFSNPTILDTVAVGNRRYQWQVNYNVAQDQAACRYDATGFNTCFGLGHLVGTTLTPGPADQTAAGNDIAVIGGVTGALAPTYSVFTAQNAADGTTGATNRVGQAAVFASAYANGDNGALKQLVWAVEQSVPIGAPVLEVQEPTTATTAAAFDEGGNFIDVRFGPLTRGTCTTSTTLTNPNCSTSWTDFGVYNPAAPAAVPLNGGSAVTTTSTSYSLFVRNLLQTDRNGSARTAANWVRGALQQ
ncbi:MAG: IPT/TIG domain-containing protein [Piscinibacter sp.]